MVCSTIITQICYVLAFAFLALGIYYLLKVKDKSDSLIGFAVFGNCFSLIFWPTTVIANAFGITILPSIALYIFAMISILLFISYIITIIYVRISTNSLI